MNQREIKFRAWDTDKKEMLENLTLKDYRLEARAVWGDELMQFTGLKDKNGKEIYEGDIVKAPAMEEDAVCEVFWEMNGWMIKNKEGQTGLTNYGGKFAPEVIGNIYENPELLK